MERELMVHRIGLRRRRMSYDIWHWPPELPSRSRHIGHCLTQLFLEGTGKHQGEI